MRLFDINVLVYAHRSDSQHHEACRQFLEATATAPSMFGVPTLALNGFLRVSTHPRVFETPTPLVDALELVGTLVERPNCATIEPGPRHWSIVTELLRDARVEGNLVPDAYLAAMAIENDDEWVTTDRDFGLLAGLHSRPREGRRELAGGNH